MIDFSHTEWDLSDKQMSIPGWILSHDSFIQEFHWTILSSDQYSSFRECWYQGTPLQVYSFFNRKSWLQSWLLFTIKLSMIYLYPATTTFLDSERGARVPGGLFFWISMRVIFFWGGLFFVYIKGACEIANFLPMLRLMVQKAGLTSWEKGSLSMFIP